MIKLIVVLAVIVIGYGFYLGVFSKDDSVGDILEKSVEITQEKAEDMDISDIKDKVKEISTEDELNIVIKESKKILNK